MYDKAKYCVKCTQTGELSDCFTSFTGVRQIENVSPVLFSIFLNDWQQFMALKHNYIIPNIVDDALSDNDVEVYLKLYALLYADDTVIFAEISSEIQRALNAMSEYCRFGILKSILMKRK